MIEIKGSLKKATTVDLSSTDDTNSYDAIYVGGDGDVKVDMLYSGTVTLISAVAGSFLPIAVTKIYKVGTTATDLVGFNMTP